MIHSCAKRGNVDAAVSWLDRMKSQKLEPDIVTYTAIINAHAKCGQAPQAERWAPLGPDPASSQGKKSPGLVQSPHLHCLGTH